MTKRTCLQFKIIADYQILRRHLNGRWYSLFLKIVRIKAAQTPESPTLSTSSLAKQCGTTFERMDALLKLVNAHLPNLLAGWNLKREPVNPLEKNAFLESMQWLLDHPVDPAKLNVALRKRLKTYHITMTSQRLAEWIAEAAQKDTEIKKMADIFHSYFMEIVKRYLLKLDPEERASATAGQVKKALHILTMSWNECCRKFGDLDAIRKMIGHTASPAPIEPESTAKTPAEDAIPETKTTLPPPVKSDTIFSILDLDYPPEYEDRALHNLNLAELLKLIALLPNHSLTTELSKSILPTVQDFLLIGLTHVSNQMFISLDERSVQPFPDMDNDSWDRYRNRSELDVEKLITRIGTLRYLIEQTRLKLALIQFSRFAPGLSVDQTTNAGRNALLRSEIAEVLNGISQHQTTSVKQKDTHREVVVPTNVQAKTAIRSQKSVISTPGDESRPKMIQDLSCLLKGVCGLGKQRLMRELATELQPVVEQAARHFLMPMDQESLQRAVEYDFHMFLKLSPAEWLRFKECTGFTFGKIKNEVSDHQTRVVTINFLLGIKRFFEMMDFQASGNFITLYNNNLKKHQRLVADLLAWANTAGDEFLHRELLNAKKALHQLTPLKKKKN